MRDSRTIALLKEGVRAAARYRLLGPGHHLPQELPAPRTVDEIDDTWLVKIIVNSEQVRIQFKVYYTVPLAKHIYQIKHMTNKDLPTRIYHDFIREFCNLAAGAIKTWLGDLITILRTDDLVVNLPDQKPALMELPPFGKADEGDVFFDSWLFKTDTHHLLCAAEIQVFDWTQVAGIEPPMHSLDDAGNDDIEFL